MSPIKKKKLDKLRKELDQLDNSLLKVIKRRIKKAVCFIKALNLMQTTNY